MIGRTNVGGGAGGGATLEDKTVYLDMASGDQVIPPSSGYDGLSKATVTRPASFVPENIKKNAVIGGITGTYEGTAVVNEMDDLVDGTMTSFTMPQGKTKVKDYLFYNVSALTSANLQGATQIGSYAFYNCANAEIALPSTLISIGDYAFMSAGKTTALMELSCPIDACQIGLYAFSSAKISKVTGKISQLGAFAFQNCSYLTEAVISQCTNVGSNAFSSCTALTKLHIDINGAVGSNAFYATRILNDVSITGNITELGSYAFSEMGCNRQNPSQNIIVLDLSNSTFKTIYALTFGSSGTNYVKYFDITLPVSVSYISNQAFQNIQNSNIFFKGSAPTLEANAFNSMSNTTLWVPYQKANEYRTKTNWTTVVSNMKAYAEENTFTTGQTLPAINDEGYGITWYSDRACTIQVTTVADSSQKLYCIVGTTILAYRIKSVDTSDCTITITDGTNTYAVNDQVPVGASLTITSAYTDPTKTQVYMFYINGTDYKPATSETIAVASDITVICLYYDGINAPFDPVLANNSWQQVLFACQNGLAGILWQVGDTKTDSAGFVWKIVDLKNARYARADGTGYTNCAFMMDPRCFDETTTWRTSSNNENYSQSLVNTKLSHNGVFYNQIDQTLAALVDQNKIVVKASQASSSLTVDCTVGFFAPCHTEMGYTGNYYNATNAETICNGVTMGAFEYFASNTNSLRIRKDSTNASRSYWLRSRLDSNYVVYVYADGSRSNDIAWDALRVCPCFAF